MLNYKTIIIKLIMNRLHFYFLQNNNNKYIENKYVWSYEFSLIKKSLNEQV